jgi:hypothetical protein
MHIEPQRPDELLLPAGPSANRSIHPQAHFSQRVRTLFESGWPESKNAIEVSFIEDLALGENNERRYKMVTERMPQSIRARMVHVHEFWKI